MRNNSELTRININLFDRIAKYYDFPLINGLFTLVQKKVINYLNIKGNSRILDVGCGTGNFLSILEKRHKTTKLYGIDISREMLRIAENKLKKSILLINSAEEMKFKNKFDYVFSTEAFHHFSNPKKAVKNFYNTLKKKGRLVIVDFEMGFIFNFLFHIIEPGNNKVFSRLEFKNLFKENNFKNIKQKRICLIFLMTNGEK